MELFTKNKRILSLLLAVCLVCAVLPAAVRASAVVEVGSASEMAQALADTPAKAMRAGNAQPGPTRVLLFAPTLPDACGAQRVLHYAAYEEFVLEFSSAQTAARAYAALTGKYGMTDCWLDTPVNGAHVMDSSATAMEADTWGESYMHLTSYRDDVRTLAHFNAAEPVIAIIDSGVDRTNEVLMARSWKSYDFVERSETLGEVTTGTTAGHGTRIASILDSVLPEHARFMYLRVFGGASAERTTVLTALQYAVENGADVINFSLGWEDDTSQSFTFLDRALTAAHEKGIPIICAAGNNHQDVENCYPANSKYTMAISAVSQRLRYDVYSNYGALVDFCAPGSGITATSIGGVTANCTGTSFAAPHITAVVVALQILHPKANADEIYKQLQALANDIGVQGKDNIFGWGIPILPEDYTDQLVHAWDAGHAAKVSTDKTEGERVFTCDICGLTQTEPIPAINGSTDSGFRDVPKTEYYAVPVTWAATNGVTDGTDEGIFSPDLVCTRAQVVTFLWRTAGCPKPTSTKNPFTDVAEDTYYYDAVLWAVENGITDGTSDTTFSPDDTCTRAHVVTFLWRFDKVEKTVPEEAKVYVVEGDPWYHDAGCKHLTSEAKELTQEAAVKQGYEECPDCRSKADPMAPADPVKPDAPAEPAPRFEDVPADAYFAEAVAWAVEHGITDGMDDTHFAPDAGCTRAHVVTFLCRYINETA